MLAFWSSTHEHSSFGACTTTVGSRGDQEWSSKGSSKWATASASPCGRFTLTFLELRMWVSLISKFLAG